MESGISMMSMAQVKEDKDSDDTISDDVSQSPQVGGRIVTYSCGGIRLIVREVDLLRRTNVFHWFIGILPSWQARRRVAFPLICLPSIPHE